MPAGTYHFVLDSIIIGPVDVTYDLIWRRGGTDTTLASWQKHWEPLPTTFDAQAYEVDQMGIAIVWQDGDLLVFRYAGANATASMAYIPNGDGELANGRIPHFTLPK